MLGLLKPLTDFYQSMITSPNNRLAQLLYYLSRDLWGPMYFIGKYPVYLGFMPVD